MVGQSKSVKNCSQSGFTIIELMIAISILSVLLVASTVILIQLGRTYSKGVNQAATQNTARNIINDIASQLQLSGDTPVIQSDHFCLGTERYNYRIGYRLTESPTDHVLWRDTTNNDSACKPLNLSLPTATPSDSTTVGNSGVELIPYNMRLTNLSVNTNTNGTYTVTVGLAYGTSDLLCDSGVPGDCASTINDSGHQLHLENPTGRILCRGGSGQEYCATSFLQTTVERRITN